MKDVYADYKEKLISADEAASYVKSGDKLFYSEFVILPANAPLNYSFIESNPEI
jgi:acyl-CoA hydrolase